MSSVERDPAKDAYIQKTVSQANRQTVSPTYIIMGGLMILALMFVSIKLGSSKKIQTSVLQASNQSEQLLHNAAIAKVQEQVSWYDTGEWESMSSPSGSGTVVIMSRDFVWLVEDSTVYNVNGLAATITPDLEYAKNVTPDDVFATRSR